LRRHVTAVGALPNAGDTSDSAGPLAC